MQVRNIHFKMDYRFGGIMAQRRMFSLKIINSARFLKMPIDTQLLYFHLGLNADDDGVVEAFTVMRYAGIAEDNLKILVAKQFVKILNEDLVTYIIDWTEHNKIRADRKIDSMYKNLLVKMLPDVQPLQSKERADRKPKKSGTSSGQPKDGIGEVRLGKDRIGKVKDIKHKYGEYKHVLLTDKQYADLPEKVDDREKWIKIVDESIEEKGNKYSIVNFSLAIQKWYKRELEEGKTGKPKTKIFTEIEEAKY